MSSSSPTEVVPADFGSRFSAFMIDASLLFVGQWMVFGVLSRQLQAVGLTKTAPCVADGVALCEGPSTALWVALFLVYLISVVGYHALFEGRFGATPGKRWMGLVVVDQDLSYPVGGTVGLLRARVRQSFWIVLLFVLEASPLALGLPALLVVILPLAALATFVRGALNSDGITFHDQLAGTQVVRKDQIPPGASRQATAAAHAGDAKTPNTKEDSS